MKYAELSKPKKWIYDHCNLIFYVILPALLFSYCMADAYINRATLAHACDVVVSRVNDHYVGADRDTVIVHKTDGVAYVYDARYSRPTMMTVNFQNVSTGTYRYSNKPNYGVAHPTCYRLYSRLYDAGLPITIKHAGLEGKMEAEKDEAVVSKSDTNTLDAVPNGSRVVVTD